MKKSGFIRKMEQKNELKYRMEFNRKMSFLQQMCVDAAFMAASDVFQMGPGRCEAFGRAMMDYLDGMSLLMTNDARDDPEIDYAREKIDRRLREICGEKFDPWEARYGKQMPNYGEEERGNDGAAD